MRNPNFLCTLYVVTLGINLAFGQPTSHNQSFSFTYRDNIYRGFIDLPADSVKAIILLIPGSGQTDFMGTGGFAQFFSRKRSFFLALGYGICAWDKKGCGQTEGDYDEAQSIDDSALEAQAAIDKLKQLGVAKPSEIGLWSISRGGWVCPKIIVNEPSIRFWISVSGPTEYDNFRFLLESNFRQDGKSDSLVAVLLQEWDFHMKSLRNHQTSYETYLLGTRHLAKDSLYTKLSGGIFSRSTFADVQELFRNSSEVFDEATGLRIVMPDLRESLRKINCPVLALFGELDSQIDWRATSTLYQETLVRRGSHQLAIATFEHCNHLMMTCETGAMNEDLSKFGYEVCPKYYETLTRWLSTK